MSETRQSKKRANSAKTISHRLNDLEGFANGFEQFKGRETLIRKLAEISELARELSSQLQADDAG